MRPHVRAKILGGRDNASNGVVGELSQNYNRDDRVELAGSAIILNVGSIGKVDVRH
jgi:hypothetical protein